MEEELIETLIENCNIRIMHNQEKLIMLSPLNRINIFRTNLSPPLYSTQNTQTSINDQSIILYQH